MLKKSMTPISVDIFQIPVFSVCFFLCLWSFLAGVFFLVAVVVLRFAAGGGVFTCIVFLINLFIVSLKKCFNNNFLDKQLSLNCNYNLHNIYILKQPSIKSI